MKKKYFYFNLEQNESKFNLIVYVKYCLKINKFGLNQHLGTLQHSESLKNVILARNCNSAVLFVPRDTYPLIYEGFRLIQKGSIRVVCI